MAFIKQTKLFLSLRPKVLLALSAGCSLCYLGIFVTGEEAVLVFES